MSATQYQVFLTPLISAGVYGTEVEISDYAKVDGVSSVSRGIDSTDYDVGIYTIADLKIVCDGSNGYLGDPSDNRSVFTYSRDLAKVRVVFSNGTATTTFRGYINEEGTSVDPQTDEITLFVLSHDSILRKNKVPAGTVTDGMSFTSAIIAILNSAGIAGYLSVNATNINPGFNGTIDDGSKFDTKQVNEALDLLLLASNSILYLDSSDNVFVKSRWQSGNPVLYLYGKGNLEGKENIVGVANYNNGLQRCFNSIRITGGQPTVTVSAQTVTQPALVVELDDPTSIAKYGLRQKDMTLDFLWTEANISAVARALLWEFRFPKIELEVTVSTELLQAQSPATDLLDQVSLDYPLRITASGKFLPVAGITTAGDSDSPAPYTAGAVTIDPTLAFKVIHIDENPTDFTTTLKLRQVGISQTDGGFTVPLSIRSVSSADQIETTDDIILANAASAGFAETLPDPTLQPYKAYTIKKTDSSSNAVTVTPNASEQIDSGGSGTGVALTRQFESITVATDGANWRVLEHYIPYIAPTVQTFTSGSGTYTRPANCKRIQVEQVGGGGGGGPSGTSGGGTPGTAGGNTTFGTSLLVANGGAGGSANGAPNTGGTASLGTGPIGIALQGGGGCGAGRNETIGSGIPCGGMGAPSPFGGAGGGGQNAGGAGQAAIANTGSGGGGGAPTDTSAHFGGSGGAAGGYVKAIINSPASSYPYAVGAGGTGGSGGDATGGNGGSGVIVVTEFYS